jgi:gliding motility-associated-like protein
VVTTTGTITVTPNNTVNRTSPAGTDAQTVCINTAITNITYATTGATGATVTGLPAGVIGSWLANVVTISGTPTAAGPFTYTVTLTGGCGVVTTTGTITINAIPTVTITDPAAVCAPATVDLTAAAVTAGSTAGLTYTYWTDAAATIAYVTPGIATAGTYYIKGSDPVTSCFDIKPVIVTVNAVPTVIITDPAAVCAPATADLTTAAVTAGSTAGLAYTYWTDVAATIAYATPATATAGTYYIKGSDPVTSCFDIKPVTVTVNAVPTVAITDPATVCAPATVDLTAVAVTAGSTAGLTYTYWTDAAATIAYATPATATAGTYYIKGSDPVDGCYNIKPVTVTVNTSPSVTTTQVDVLCFGAMTGSATAVPSGGTGVYTYSWNTVPVQTSVTATGLAAGTYTVTVNDGICISTADVTITEPASALSGSISLQTNVTVPGGNDGSVTVAGSGGTSPYLYKIGSGAYQASGSFGTLTAGIYTVTVQDINLCHFDITVTITEPSAALSGSITSQTNVDCFGSSTGSVSVEGSGGVPPYEYSLNSGPYQASGTFASLAAGSYIITVIDAALITSDVNFTITQPATSVSGSIISQTNILCSGSNTGSVTVAGSGGTPPYLYSLGGGSYQVSGTFGTLTVGSHTVTVQDVNLCTFDVGVILTEPATALKVNTVSTASATCFGSSDGSIEVAGSGGVAPYMYSINGGTYLPSGIFNNLASATYTISVIDANLCTADVSINVPEPAALSIASTKVDASCPGTDDGSITLTITGGTEPYSTIWSDNNTHQDRQDISDGNYSVIVTDKNGCAASLDVVVGVVGTENCLVIPDIITPNSDGFDDTWQIKNIDLFPNAEIFIFTRWGKLVFHTKNLSANPWDGTFRGSPLPTDSYHYVLHLNDGSKTRSGVISIIR